MRASAAIAAKLTKEFLQEEYVEGKRSTGSIAKELGICDETVKGHLLRHGMEVRDRHYWGNKRNAAPNAYSLFNPQSDWAGYWLGFIAADGCVAARKGRPFLTIQLKGEDGYILDSLREGLGVEKPVMRHGRTYPVAHFTDNDSTLVDALARWGILPRKSLTITFPNDLPERVLPSFVRGYFDGNGTAIVRNRQGRKEHVVRFTSGSPLFVIGLAAVLNRYRVLTASPYFNQGSKALVLPLRTTRDNLQRFAHFIYDGQTVCLTRKQEKFAEFLEEESMCASYRLRA